MLMLAEQGGAELVPESAAAAVESASGLAVGQFRRPRRWRAIVGGVLALSIVAGVAVLALNDWGTHKQLTKSRDAYSASQSRLHETQAELADTVTKLTGVKTDLTSTQSVLATTKKSLDAKAQALTAKEQELAGVRNNLTDVKSSLTIQSGQIKTLESCLNGVSIALTDVSYNDYSGAASALEAVKVSCNAAFALF
jgi:septal ring factor EnvC (AmiA/AmiB activator)